MKIALLLCALGVLGYCAYLEWFAKPAPPPPPKVVQAKPAPVDFVIKSRVRKLLAEWKRRALSANAPEHGSATIDAAAELTEIRKALFRDGIHSEAAVGDVVIRALRELGVPENEIREVTNGILRLE